MKKGIVTKLKKLIPSKNIAFSWCACGTWRHTVHSQALKKNKSLFVS